MNINENIINKRKITEGLRRNTYKTTRISVAN